MIPSIARIVVLSLVCQVAFAETPPPNIIFLLADDQNFDSLGCYGNEDVLTPNIDALAARGMAFDNHYDTTAICMASRANILTGMSEYKTGCNFEHGDLPENLWQNQRIRLSPTV